MAEVQIEEYDEDIEEALSQISSRMKQSMSALTNLSDSVKPDHFRASEYQVEAAAGNSE